LTRRKFYIGSSGPFLYNDDDLIDDQDGYFPNELRHAIVAEDQILIYGIPTSDEHAMRRVDVDKLIAIFTVSDLDDPSAELSTKTGNEGGLVIIFENNVGTNRYAIYSWDDDSITEDIPYIVSGIGGVWVLVADGRRGYTGELADENGTILADVFNGRILSVSYELNRLTTELEERLRTESGDYITYLLATFHQLLAENSDKLLTESGNYLGGISG